MNILHLEDTPADAELIGRAITNGGITFTKFWAENKQDFIRGLKEFPADIILSDHSLPGFDSHEALEIFKATGLKIPFIIVTANTSEKFVAQILKEGADDYLLKSNLAQLPKAIQRALKIKNTELEKERAYQELSNREEHYFALIQYSKDLTTLVDPEGKIKFQSPSIEHLLGYTPTELLGSSIFDLIHPDDVEKAKLRLADRLSKKAENESLEFRLKTKKGRWKIMESVGANLLHNPSVNAFIINSRDITERKQLENKLINKIKELDTFIYKASHDLKGPLSSIIGIVNLAKDDNPGTVQNTYLDMIGTSTTKLDSVLTGLIETMRVKDVVSKSESIDLESMIYGVLKSLEFSNIYFSKTNFIVNVSNEKIFYSIPTIIHSVLQNIIENAIKYHNYEQKQPTISITATNIDNGVWIEIEDNGHGMSTEVQDRIFEMYYRGNESSQGSGLGLYIVKTAIDRLEGEIRVNSKEECGTKFSLYLPSMPLTSAP